ncbi:hypothetical protein DOT_5539 [Desulfosporosinus sp. OT]|nr:hypothetical protein DOT_5539 [Desulfosporosinus sp. OT]
MLSNPEVKVEFHRQLKRRTKRFSFIKPNARNPAAIFL